MNKAVYRHLLTTYGRKPRIWFGVLTGMLQPFLLVILSAVVMSQLASHVAQGDLAGAQKFVWLLFAVNIAGVGTHIVGELIGGPGEEQVYRNVQLRYYDKLVGKDMNFYRDHQTGYLTGLFRQYQDNGMLLVRMIRQEGMRTVVVLVAPVVVLMLVNWRIGLVIMGVVGAQVAYIVWASARANKYRLLSHEIYRKTTGEVADQITNIVAFKSSGNETFARRKVERLADDEVHTFWQRRKLTTFLDVPRGLITSIGLLVVFQLILTTSGSGPEAVGTIVLVLAYMLGIIRNVNELPSLITRHDDLITKLHPTLSYLTDEHESIKDPAQPKDFKVRSGAISIEGVSFSYPSHSSKGTNTPVFDNLNIEIKGGEHVGIVGLSGAGKSTLASLLMRFDDVGKGAISIDGTDIRKIKQSELRSHIAYVPQEPLLFHRSIRENIAYFDPNASQEQIESAAKAAHAHEFVERLPDGYDTIVGERGVKLSGGQKQRVVIARSILKNAPIMLFDEATSALDSESEKIIQQALPEITGKHTAIVIAHRLSTIAGMDRILVMHNGEVIEEGSHKELLTKRGRYYTLWQKQSHD